MQVIDCADDAGLQLAKDGILIQCASFVVGCHVAGGMDSTQASFVPIGWSIEWFLRTTSTEPIPSEHVDRNVDLVSLRMLRRTSLTPACIQDRILRDIT